MKRWLRTLSLAAVLSAAASAHAQAFELTWDAPSECPDATAMRARITHLIAGAEVSGQALEAVGRIDRHADRWRLNLELNVSGRHATRELEDSDCTSLSETAAWLVSVAIDPHLAPPSSSDVATTGDENPVPASDADTARDAAPAPATAEPETTSVRDEQPEQGAASRVPLRWRLGGFGGVFAGKFAGLAASVGAEAGIELGAVSLAVSGARHFERSRALPAPNTYADFASLELGLEGCFEWGERLRIGPCALLSVLRTAASTRGVSDGQDADFVWATGGASIEARYALVAPLELLLNAGLWVPISARPRFEVENLGTAGEAAALGGRIRLGVGVLLP